MHLRLDVQGPVLARALVVLLQARDGVAGPAQVDHLEHAADGGAQGGEAAQRLCSGSRTPSL